MYVRLLTETLRRYSIGINQVVLIVTDVLKKRLFYLVYRLYQIFNDVLSIAKHHHGFI
jgi:hypothetical protein